MLQDASQAFQAGKYDEARKIYYDIYVEDGDTSSKELLAKCQQCRTLIADATAAERDGEYEHAIKRYQAVISLNPSDNKIPALISQCKERLYTPKLQLAKQYYREGKYVEARDKLREYASISGQTDEGLLLSITECLTWKNEADEAKNNKNYDIAKFYLEKILSHNSTDAISAQSLAEVNGLNQKVKTVFVKEPTKRSLRPFKNKFNFFIYSGFSNPVAFGGGIGFNVSYFHLNLDGGGPMDQEGIKDGFIYEKYIKNCVKINENTYVQGKMQLAITPGINLKYFSLGVGFGPMMTKELSIEDGYKSGSLSGDESNKSRFLIRPTINGFIPFDSDYTGGLMIMAGYNIVSGVSGLNQFILGAGVFF